MFSPMSMNSPESPSFTLFLCSTVRLGCAFSSAYSPVKQSTVSVVSSAPFYLHCALQGPTPPGQGDAAQQRPVLRQVCPANSRQLDKAIVDLSCLKTTTHNKWVCIKSNYILFGYCWSRTTVHSILMSRGQITTLKKTVLFCFFNIFFRRSEEEKILWTLLGLHCIN